VRFCAYGAAEPEAAVSTVLSRGRPTSQFRAKLVCAPSLFRGHQKSLGEIEIPLGRLLWLLSGHFPIGPNPEAEDCPVVDSISSDRNDNDEERIMSVMPSRSTLRTSGLPGERTLKEGPHFAWRIHRRKRSRVDCIVCFCSMG
jgi:hypothetical protein